MRDDPNWSSILHRPLPVPAGIKIVNSSVEANIVSKQSSSVQKGIRMDLIDLCGIN